MPEFNLSTKLRAATSLLSAIALMAALPVAALNMKDILLSTKVTQIAAMALGGGSFVLNLTGSLIQPKAFKKRLTQLLPMSFLSLSLAGLGGLGFGGILPNNGLQIGMMAIGGLGFILTLIIIYKTVRKFRGERAQEDDEEDYITANPKLTFSDPMPVGGAVPGFNADGTPNFG